MFVCTYGLRAKGLCVVLYSNCRCTEVAACCSVLAVSVVEFFNDYNKAHG